MNIEQRQTLGGNMFYYNSVTQASQLNKPSTFQSESMIILYPPQGSDFFLSLSSLDLYSKRHAELEFSEDSHFPTMKPTTSSTVVTSYGDIEKQLNNLKYILQGTGTDEEWILATKILDYMLLEYLLSVFRNHKLDILLELSAQCLILLGNINIKLWVDISFDLRKLKILTISSYNLITSVVSLCETYNNCSMSLQSLPRGPFAGFDERDIKDYGLNANDFYDEHTEQREILKLEKQQLETRIITLLTLLFQIHKQDKTHVYSAIFDEETQEISIGDFEGRSCNTWTSSEASLSPSSTSSAISSSILTEPFLLCSSELEDGSDGCQYFIVSSYSTPTECAEEIMLLLKPLLQCLRVRNDTIHSQCILCIAALNRQYTSLMSLASPSSRDLKLKLVEMACMNSDEDEDQGLMQVNNE